MLKDKIATLRRLHLACDLILTCAAFLLGNHLSAVLHGGSPIGNPAGYPPTQHVLIICVIWGVLIFREKQSYAYRTKPYWSILRDTLRVIIIGTLLFVGWLVATNTLDYGRSFFVVFAASDLLFLYGLRVVVLRFLHFLRVRGFSNQNVIVVGTGDLAKSTVDDLKEHPEWGFRVIGLLDWEDMTTLWRYRDIPLIGSLPQMPEIIKNNQVDYVIFAVGHRNLDKVDSAFKICEEMGTEVCLLADFFSTNIARREITEFLGRPAFLYSTTSDSRFQIFLKGLIDHVGAMLGLIVISPLMILVAVVIKLTSRGPVFFKQERCGLNGRRFRVLKFRTMVQDAEKLKESLRDQNEMDGPAFKIKNDPRITRLGRILRKTSVDELPQLINVAKGEMSLVGPRPPIPDEVVHYDRWQRRKLSMKPGLTCLWQVGDRNDTTFDEWMNLDLKYIDNWSLWMDTKILLKTIPTVINATGK